MQKTIRLLGILVIGLWMAGCSTAPTYTIKVNGYTDPGAPAPVKPGGFFCVMDNPETKNPLLEKEIKEKISKLLVTHGYPVTTFEKADYFLFFAYGMGEPRSVSTFAPDYYGGVGWGLGYGRGGWGGWGGPSIAVGVPFGGYPADSVTLYDRWLLIKVVEGQAHRAQKAAPPVWVGEARSVGASSDLRVVLNYLLVADFKEFGKNTGKALTMSIDAENPEVTSLTH
jgi:Domain of unknown function (DUF4136)